MGHDLAQRVADANGPNASAEPAQRPDLARQIQQMEQQFGLALPKGSAEAGQLVRDALTCLRTTPSLARCEPTTVLGALMTCAQLGLRPGVLGHAWLLPFRDRRDGVHKAELVIGYQGLVDLAHRSGRVASLVARTVYEGDTFDVEYGLSDNLIHKPKLFGERGEPIAYYAVVHYTSGGHGFVVMSHAEMCDYRDKHAKSTRGPWRDHFEPMSWKTCVRQLSRWMPRSTELATALAADNTVRADVTPDADAPLHAQHIDIQDAELVTDEPTDEQPADE